MRSRTLAAAAGDDLTDLARRVAGSLLGRCVQRFFAMRGIDQGMVLASQAFTALIPLLILFATWAPVGEDAGIATFVIRKFSLEGSAAAAVTQLFAVPEGATSSISALSAILLVISGTSFTRRFQRMYRAAYRQEKAGVRSGIYSTLGLFVLVVEVMLLYGLRTLVARLPLSWLLTLPLAILTGALLWTSIPYLLLNRQVHWRRLVLGGVIAGTATAVFSIVTTLYMPDQIQRYTSQFGLFGVTIAIIGWLLVVAVIQVASAAIGAELDAALTPWIFRLKIRFRLEDPALERPEPTPEDLAAGLTGDDIRLVIRVLGSWAVLTAAVWVATLVVPGIDVPAGLDAHILVSLLLGLVSALLGAVPRVLVVPKPVLAVAAVAVVVNGLLLVVVAALTPGFEVASFRAALLGGLVIACVTAVLEVGWQPIKQHL